MKEEEKLLGFDLGSRGDWTCLVIGRWEGDRMIVTDVVHLESGNADQHIRDWHRGSYKDRFSFPGRKPPHLEAWRRWHLNWLILDKRYIWSLGGYADI